MFATDQRLEGEGVRGKTAGHYSQLLVSSPVADVAQGRLASEPNIDGEVIRQIPMPSEIREEINRVLLQKITHPSWKNITRKYLGD